MEKQPKPITRCKVCQNFCLTTDLKCKKGKRFFENLQKEEAKTKKRSKEQ